MKTFDPYQPATHLAESLGYVLCRQFGQCWLMDKHTFQAVEVPEPSVWKPAKTVIEENTERLACFRGCAISEN